MVRDRTIVMAGAAWMAVSAAGLAFAGPPAGGLTATAPPAAKTPLAVAQPGRRASSPAGPNINNLDIWYELEKNNTELKEISSRQGYFLPLSYEVKSVALLAHVDKALNSMMVLIHCYGVSDTATGHYSEHLGDGIGYITSLSQALPMIQEQVKKDPGWCRENLRVFGGRMGSGSSFPMVPTPPLSGSATDAAGQDTNTTSTTDTTNTTDGASPAPPK